jgi:Peptidase A4 family
VLAGAHTAASGDPWARVSPLSGGRFAGGDFPDSTNDETFGLNKHPRIKSIVVIRLALVAVLLAVLLAARAGAQVLPSAVAQTRSAVSHNWAGYAVTAKASTTKFTSVSGAWLVPHGKCDSAHPGHTAVWVGIGGFKRGSRALEQAGTEFDCGADGRAEYSAWFELLPAPARVIKMTLHPGDRIHTTVTVRGKRVTIYMRNGTRGKAFRRSFRMSAPASSSAEWIVEAPSKCKFGRRCTQLPLSNFGTVSFRRAQAVTAFKRHGGIAYPRWSNTRLVLSQRAGGQDSTSAGARIAEPSALRARGTAFSVAYKG